MEATERADNESVASVQKHNEEGVGGPQHQDKPRRFRGRTPRYAMKSNVGLVSGLQGAPSCSHAQSGTPPLSSQQTRPLQWGAAFPPLATRGTVVLPVPPLQASSRVRPLLMHSRFPAPAEFFRNPSPGGHPKCPPPHHASTPAPSVQQTIGGQAPQFLENTPTCPWPLAAGRLVSQKFPRPPSGPPSVSDALGPGTPYGDGVSFRIPSSGASLSQPGRSAEPNPAPINLSLPTGESGAQWKQRSESVAERVLRFLHYGRERAVSALRCSQKVESDGNIKKEASRGPGNRPRGIWALHDVQEMQLEVIGKAGLGLYNAGGTLKINPSTGKPYKNLQPKYAIEARDTIETLLLSFHSGYAPVEKAIGEASGELRKEGHFLSVEVVRQQCVRLMDRLLDHLDSLEKEPGRGLGDWTVKWTPADTSFVKDRLDEFVEEGDNGQIKYTHFGEFVGKYKFRLPSHTTPAYVRMVVTTIVQDDFEPADWCKHVIKIKRSIDQKAKRDGSQLNKDWVELSVERLVNVLRFYGFTHPLRREDVKLRLTLATVNPLALHYGLSGASLDKIRDGTGPDSPGYRLKKQGYERVLRLYEADPANFTMTYALARDMGNVQLVLLWDNIAKGDADFEDFAAYGVMIGQYKLSRYASYFEMSEAAAQRNIDTALARMREVARNGVEPSTGRDSWLARQNRRVTGSRRRAKGVQLTRRVSMAEARAIYHAQQETCCATGQPIILGNGGSKSPFSAAMVLVGASETVQLMGSWTARGQGVCPLAAYKDFFEYWGVEGHEYMRFLKMGPDGEPVDELERQVKAILRVDGVGPGGDGGTGDDEGETEGVSNASRPEPKCETRPPPLPFADIDYTWAAMRVPLSEVTVNPRDEKHRRDGLSLLRPSPCLAEFDDAELQKSAAYKGPVLVEKDNLALRWAGQRTRNRLRLQDRAAANVNNSGTEHLLALKVRKRKRTLSAFLKEASPEVEAPNSTEATLDSAPTPSGDVESSAENSKLTNRPDMADCDEGAPATGRRLRTHYFMPRPPRRSAAEVPVPAPSDSGDNPAENVAIPCLWATTQDSARQPAKKVPCKDNRRLTKEAPTAPTKVLLKPTFSKRSRTRDEVAAPSQPAVSPAAEEVGSASTGVGGSVEATPISIDGDRPVQLSVGPPKEASAYESDKAPEVSLPDTSGATTETTSGRVVLRPTFSRRKKNVDTTSLPSPSMVPIGPERATSCSPPDVAAANPISNDDQELPALAAGTLGSTTASTPGSPAPSGLLGVTNKRKQPGDEAGIVKDSSDIAGLATVSSRQADGSPAVQGKGGVPATPAGAAQVLKPLGASTATRFLPPMTKGTKSSKRAAFVTPFMSHGVSE